MRRAQLRSRGSAAKIEARRLANFGTKTRHDWWYTLPCACAGLHPACTGGRSDPSHTSSRAVEGDDSTIIPQSRGCHDFIGSHGWLVWERHVGALLEGGNGASVAHIVGEGRKLRLDRHALAAEWATMGPDAPGAA